MQELHLQKVVEKSGELFLKDLPFKKGQNLDLIVFPHSAKTNGKKKLTAAELLNSELVGLWKNRNDIDDSVSFARTLREKAQKREK
jgi:hypothetical protein